jgi:hypothetical protein
MKVQMLTADLMILSLGIAACCLVGALLRRRGDERPERRFAAAVARGDLDEAEQCAEEWFGLASAGQTETPGGHGEHGDRGRVGWLAAPTGPYNPYWRLPPWFR